MATPKETFTTPLPSEPIESSLAAPMGNLEEMETSLAAAQAVLGSIAHLIIAPERLTFVDCTESDGALCDVYFAKLDETSHTPKDVTVERLRVDSKVDSLSKAVIRLARQLEARKGLRHPNVLELIGYYLNPDSCTAQVISPYMIQGRLSEDLARSPVGIAQRLGFVRDITSGLDYLHSHNPPICHGDLRVKNIHVDENLNAVLSCFGLTSIQKAVDNSSGLTSSVEPVGPLRYYPPEILIGEHTKPSPESDVWAWGCTTFEHQKSNSAIFGALLKRALPAQPERLLSLVPQAPKPEYASTLRFLRSYIPICWEYEPRNRPSISLVRQQAFMFSFESDAGDSVVASLEELAHLLIPTERLLLVERPLGSGTYGEVILGTLDHTSPTPRNVEVKRLKPVGTRGQRVRLAKRLARKLNIWAKIKHPNVVELIGWYLDETYESPLLISEFMVLGNVLDYIKGSNPEPDTEQSVSFVKGITAGLACLHSFDPPICHADLKPANVLIDLHRNAVLCDFGLASFVSGSGVPSGLVTSTTLQGSPRYMSPELLLEKQSTHSLESDVWAWGCTVFQVLTDYVPYAEAIGEGPFYLAVSQYELPGDVALLPKSSESTNSDTSDCLRFLEETVPQCWDLHPQERPSVCTLLSHISRPSFQTDRESGEREDVASSGLPPDKGTGPLAKLDNPPGEIPAKDERPPGKIGIPTNAYPEDEKVVEDYLRVDQEETKSREAADGCEHQDKDHNIGKNQVTEITPNCNTVDEDDRQGRARAEGSSGEDGGMTDEEEDDQDECNALKAQLLALVAAIDKRAQIRGSQAPPKKSGRMRGIRKALGDKWESQLAKALQDIDRDQKNDDTTATPRVFEEKQASQDPARP